MLRDQSPSLLIREADPDDCDALLELLAADGWPPSRLSEGVATGTVLELYDPAFLVPRGAAIVHSPEEAVYELLAWATDLDVDSAVVAERLVGAIGDILRRFGGQRVIVSASDLSPDRIAPLLAVGFRPAPERDGVRDLMWLDQEL